MKVIVSIVDEKENGFGDRRGFTQLNQWMNKGILTKRHRAFIVRDKQLIAGLNADGRIVRSVKYSVLKCPTTQFT
jgi:hypothetical protein